MADALQEAPSFPSCKTICQQADSTNKYTNDFIPKDNYNLVHDGYFIEHGTDYKLHKITHNLKLLLLVL